MDMKETAFSKNPQMILAEPSVEPFSYELQQLVDGAPKSVFLVISPAMAKVMLKRNTDDTYRNRPVAQSTVNRYVRAMREGWIVTGETIVFSEDGVLLNGQHRLHACIQAKCTFETYVVFGVDRAAFKFMDRGLKRSAAHVFAIESNPNYSCMAAATTWVWRIRENGGWASRGDKSPENDQLLAYYHENERLQESAWIAHKIGSEGEHLISNALMTALHYLFAHKNRALADDFMLKVITGIGIEDAREPENVMRKWLLKDNMELGGRTDDVYRAAYIVLAWNARRQGKSVRNNFKWRTNKNPDVSFPAIR